MKVLSILVLLYSAAPSLGSITCSIRSGNAQAAANMAVNHINKHHYHGYKFAQSGVKINKMKLMPRGCKIGLKLDLKETTCHVVNPKSHEDCKLREDHLLLVLATCSVTIFVKGSDAYVNKYNCLTRREKTNVEVGRMCPDCPVLISLTDKGGLKYVSEAVRQFNQRKSNKHYYILQEVGRMTIGYMFTSGMGYFAEFVLVETQCPAQSSIPPEGCDPLCPYRTHYAFCKSSYTTVHGLTSVDCEFYPSNNTTALEKEPVSPRHHAAKGGRPPGNDGQSHKIPVIHHHSPPCNGVLKDYDRALHPICPWPLPGRRLGPRPSES